MTVGFYIDLQYFIYDRFVFLYSLFRNAQPRGDLAVL